VQPPPASLPFQPSQPAAVKPPRLILDDIYRFPPNRETLGGAAYLLVDRLAASSNILVDCPPWNETYRAFLQTQGGVRWLFLTHRSAIGCIEAIQQAFHCEILIQEQEAYLLPGLTVTRFEQAFRLSADIEAIWTPGHSPGAACLYCDRQSGVLFSGRHLLPNAQGQPVPLRIAKTFHWRRQLQSVQRLRDRFTPETLRWICPGANTGFLRGQPAIDRAYEQLAELDLEALLHAKPLL